MDELARKYVEIHDPEIREEIYRLSRQLWGDGEGVKGGLMKHTNRKLTRDFRN